MSVYDIIIEGSNFNCVENQREIEKLLDEFNLQHEELLNASVLSGGEIRRLTMARVMINKPKIVLLTNLCCIRSNCYSRYSKIYSKIQASGTQLVTDHNVKFI